jgi:hypothetical protein
VKPQFLPLIGLYFLWHRKWRAIGWFMAGALLWLGLTLFLAGSREGVEAYVNVVQRSVSEGSNSLARLMPNWRFLAFVLFGGDALAVLWFTVGLSLATVVLLAWSVAAT